MGLYSSARTIHAPALRTGGHANNRARWQAAIGQGHHAENININNNLRHWLDSIFLGRFLRLVENTGKKRLPAVEFVGIFVGIGN
jgi:hypothetical protein